MCIYVCLAMQDGGDHGALVAGEEEPGQVAEEEHGDGADEDHLG